LQNKALGVGRLDQRHPLFVPHHTEIERWNAEQNRVWGVEHHHDRFHPRFSLLHYTAGVVERSNAEQNRVWEAPEDPHPPYLTLLLLLYYSAKKEPEFPELEACLLPAVTPRCRNPDLKTRTELSFREPALPETHHHHHHQSRTQLPLDLDTQLADFQAPYMYSFAVEADG
jgi:hypothetical protein